MKSAYDILFEKEDDVNLVFDYLKLIWTDVKEIKQLLLKLQK
jgi:hypothetical protein